MLYRCIMIATSNLSCSQLETNFVEPIVRVAIEGGELAPGAEAQVRWLMLRGELGERDRALICLLQDAIQAGCVRRVSLDEETF
jgi:hypothetical protein